MTMFCIGLPSWEGVERLEHFGQCCLNNHDMLDVRILFADDLAIGLADCFGQSTRTAQSKVLGPAADEKRCFAEHLGLGRLAAAAERGYSRPPIGFLLCER